MRKRTLAWTGLWAVVLAGTAAARGESSVGGPSTRPAATTQALLAELASDDWRVRQGAINELVKRGPGARGEIERALAETSDPSAQADLRAALRRIDEDARFGMTRVTMHLGEGVTGKAAFAELGRQAGLKFVTMPPNAWEMKRVSGPVTGDWDGAPFWTVLEDLCDRTGLVPNPGMMAGGDPRAMALFMSGGNGMLSGPTCVSGPCAIVAGSAQRNQTVQFARGLGGGVAARNADLRVQVHVWVEPKVRVVSMSRITVTEAGDELGHSLVLPPGAGGGGAGGGWPGGRGIFSAALPLRDVDGIGKTLAVLKGVARLGVVASAETVEASTAGDGVGGAARVINGVRVRVTSLKEEANMCTVKIACTADDPRQRLDMLWETAQSGGMRMIDAEGRGLIANGVSPSARPTPASIEITGRFQMMTMGDNMQQTKATPPIKMVWEVPLGVKELTVPFEFKDLPLP